MARVLKRRASALPVGVDSAQAIITALRGLQGLAKAQAPDYDDEWLSLLYVAWYQPTHVNMAYTLVQSVPDHHNPLSSGKGGLHVQDFACGPFAMQFGFALALAEKLRDRGSGLVPTIYSHDNSDRMWNLGLDLYQEFHRVIENHSEGDLLFHMTHACTNLRFRAPEPPFPRSTNWLTVLHAAYPGEIGTDIEIEVERRLMNQRPEIVIVTAHPDNKEYMFVPTAKSYRAVASRTPGPQMSLGGSFDETTLWRSDLLEHHIEPYKDMLSEEDFSFAANFLTKHPTSWKSDGFRYVYSLYERR